LRSSADSPASLQIICSTLFGSTLVQENDGPSAAASQLHAAPITARPAMNLERMATPGTRCNSDDVFMRVSPALRAGGNDALPHRTGDYVCAASALPIPMQYRDWDWPRLTRLP
jgi:hypothetical protein